MIEIKLKIEQGGPDGKFVAVSAETTGLDTASPGEVAMCSIIQRTLTDIEPTASVCSKEDTDGYRAQVDRLRRDMGF